MMLRKTRDKEAAQAAPPSANFLHEAVRANRRSVVADLLSKEATRAHINSFDNFGCTPLHIAASGGSKELVELLLQYGANPSIADKSCWTPLHSAANAGDYEACKILLKAGADAMALTDAGTSALHYLVRHSTDEVELFTEVLTLLLNKGADIDSQNKHGESPLIQASFRGKKQSVDFLLEHHAEVNVTTKTGETSLHFAARIGREDIVSALLAAGADPNIRGDYGTCKDVAIAAGHNHLIAIIDSHLEKPSKKKSLLPEDPPFIPSNKSLLIGPRGILPRQRRLRHINFIYGRSLSEADPNGLMDVYLTLHEKEDSKPFYTSEVVTDSLNPMWRGLDTSEFEEMESSPGECVIFVVRVWNCRVKDKHKLIFQSIMDLNRLGYVGTNVEELGLFPTNSLVFEMGDGLYLREETVAVMRTANQLALLDAHPSLDNRKTGRTAAYSEFIQVLRIKRELEFQIQQAASHTKVIEQRRIQHTEYLELAQKRDILRSRVGHLRREVEARQQKQQREIEDVRESRKLLIPRARMLSKAQIAFLACKQKLNEELSALDVDRQLLSALRAALDKRRWRLISEIVEIYPIQPVSSAAGERCLSVNLAKLPNADSFFGYEEEEIATALGSVCHVLFLVSKYLDVPLRYPILPMCSRSAIWDEISINGIFTKYPLYSRGVDKKSFDIGVFLLNKDLEQLLNSQGWDVLTLRATLPNLQNLLSRGKANPRTTYNAPPSVGSASSPRKLHPSPRSATPGTPSASMRARKVSVNAQSNPATAHSNTPLTRPRRRSISNG